MKLCLYLGKKKKKTGKKARKAPNVATAANGTQRSRNTSTDNKKPKRAERRKKCTLQLAVDPPVSSVLGLPQFVHDDVTSVRFWEFVESYVANISSEDLNFLNNMMTRYSKENQVSDIPPLGCKRDEDIGSTPLTRDEFPSLSHSREEFAQLVSSVPNKLNDWEYLTQALDRPNSWCSRLELPENIVERIVGALVDPDLFPDDDTRTENLLDNRGVTSPMQNELDAYLEPKRIKLFDDNLSTVFSDKSNFSVYKSSPNIRGGPPESESIPGETICDKNSEEQSDEVLQEILKCQRDLKLVCSENERKLMSLSNKVEKELQHEELKQTLRVYETELVNLSQKSIGKKIKKETVTSSSKRSTESLKLLIQKRNELTGSLNKLYSHASGCTWTS